MLWISNLKFLRILSTEFYHYIHMCVCRHKRDIPLEGKEKDLTEWSDIKWKQRKLHFVSFPDNIAFSTPARGQLTLQQVASQSRLLIHLAPHNFFLQNPGCICFDYLAGGNWWESLGWEEESCDRGKQMGRMSAHGICKKTAFHL